MEVDSGNGDGNGGNGGAVESKFVGEWKIQDTEQIYVFNSKGSFYANWPGRYEDNRYRGTWEVRGNLICTIEMEDEGPNEECLSFEFSNNDETITVSTGSFQMVLIKQ